MKKKCLFLINGLGLGNSTRCFAVIEHLLQAGMEVHVATSGNGLKFFQDKPLTSLHSTDAYFYSGRDGRVSGWRTYLSMGAHIKSTLAKHAQIGALLESIKPDVAITDSEYAILPMKRRKIPIIALNNAEVVVSEYFRHKTNPADIKGHFWLIEYADYLFHKWMCDLVLSPSPYAKEPVHSKFKRIGMIVRNALVKAIDGPRPTTFLRPRNIKEVVFMLSGSIFASAISFENDKFPFHIDVVGRSGTNAGNVIFHGRKMDNIDLLKKADVLVINGGASAVSEALFLGKPTFVIPVPGHAEQFVNARMVRELGLGYIAEEKNVIGQLMNTYQNNEWPGLTAPPPLVDTDGTRQAAMAICEFLEQRRARVS